MKVTIYETYIGEDRLPFLAKEKEIEYSALSTVRSPEQARDLLCNAVQLDRHTEEIMWILCMDSACHLIGMFQASRGSACEAYCPPKEILMKSLLCGAVNVIIAHNHPSGEADPSDEDIESAKHMRKALDMVGLDMQDFIIIGRGKFWSFRRDERWDEGKEKDGG